MSSTPAMVFSCHPYRPPCRGPMRSSIPSTGSQKLNFFFIKYLLFSFPTVRRDESPQSSPAALQTQVKLFFSPLEYVSGGVSHRVLEPARNTPQHQKRRL